jgi:mxaJ protein
MFRASLLRPLAYSGLLVAVGAAPVAAQRPGPLQPGVLRVCADPDNLPFSNQKGEGFENKIAELIASEWKSKLQYIWYPVRRGYFRILNGMYCDLIIQAPGGLDMAGTTEPYYRSGYAFVTRSDSKLADIKSLADPRLKKARIGVTLLPSDEQPPPSQALHHYGVVGNLKGYSAMYNEEDRPEDVINAVAKGEVDIAIVWGPLAGYFAKRTPVPLKIHPLAERDSMADIPFRYNIGMAVRRRDRALRDSVQALIKRKEPQIQRILKEYGVPLFPIKPEAAEDDDGPRAAAPISVPADSVRASKP